MSNIKEFYKKLKEDETLQKELREETNKENIKVTIEMAKKHGFKLVESDFEITKEDLSEEELDMVAAGSGCACFVGGGGGNSIGSKQTRDFVCACVAGGGGERCTNMSDYSDRTRRCLCVVVGDGTGAV